MKKIFTLFFLLTSGVIYAQEMPEMGIKVRIPQSDKTIVAEINEVSAVPSPKANLVYYWYYANGIHSTQGGFSGKLLDGQYSEFYLSKNLKEQGFFKKGLKQGPWKSWNEDGTLKEQTKWKNGVLVADKVVPFWKRINILKKNKITPADTIKKTAK
ncbi:toxin-antitoxin system YwqK family antitoxin [Mucilaginibacter sp. X4EP1]|uniref:toxin-antitoxin system YwqK family antitoxin n=1 Tax=Mucilaginibacter sp. X4EP1 TaxID=2723092 RepID=UPI00216A5880|nr:hypothetical protein [Mucilaginibacter sp. X4EP1]MCS3816567.1 hypothetical protein [Mucilaginibacter sp. X4EP1]